MSNTNDVNFDFECRKMVIAIANVVNQFDLPLTMKIYALDEITNACKQQAEINIQNGFQEEARQKEQAKPQVDENGIIQVGNQQVGSQSTPIQKPNNKKNKRN